MSGPSHPQENHILAALPQPERDRLFQYLKLVPLPLGKVLYESGDTLRHIYFPIISLLYVLNDGAPAEIAVVGNEGAIGVALCMGGETELIANMLGVRREGVTEAAGRLQKLRHSLSSSIQVLEGHRWTILRGPKGSIG